MWKCEPLNPVLQVAFKTFLTAIGKQIQTGFSGLLVFAPWELCKYPGVRAIIRPDPLPAKVEQVVQPLSWEKQRWCWRHSLMVRRFRFQIWSVCGWQEGQELRGGDYLVAGVTGWP